MELICYWENEPNKTEPNIVLIKIKYLQINQISTVNNRKGFVIIIGIYIFKPPSLLFYLSEITEYNTGVTS